MSYIDEILEFNKEFVKNESYKKFESNKYPNKKIAIISCMDTRLTELLPAALNFKNGDIKIIKTAGAIVTHPFGSVMRSVLVSIYELGVTEIMVIAHHDCGIQHLQSEKVIEKMLARGIEQSAIDMINYCRIDLNQWLEGFIDVKTSVIETVHSIQNHPLIPKDINVYGFIIDPHTGLLEPVTV